VGAGVLGVSDASSPARAHLRSLVEVSDSTSFAARNPAALALPGSNRHVCTRARARSSRRAPSNTGHRIIPPSERFPCRSVTRSRPVNSPAMRLLPCCRAIVRPSPGVQIRVIGFSVRGALLFSTASRAMPRAAQAPPDFPGHLIPQNDQVIGRRSANRSRSLVIFTSTVPASPLLFVMTQKCPTTTCHA